MRKIRNTLVQFFEIFRLTLKSSYSVLDKLSLLKAQMLCFWGVKLKLKTKVVTLRIIGFRISSYGYFNLLFQIQEIFLMGEYEISTSKSAAPLIIDCGANIGLSSLYFKRKYPDCRIIAFEPNPNVFKILKQNIEQNNLQGIQLFNCCLSKEVGEIEFFINENLGTMEGSIVAKRGGNQKLNVKSVKLSSFINEPVDLIKMDIEGAESDVIQELMESGKISLIANYLIEYHHNIPSQKSALGQFLMIFEENGFGINIRGSFKNQHDYQDVFLKIFQVKNSA